MVCVVMLGGTPCKQTISVCVYKGPALCRVLLPRTPLLLPPELAEMEGV